MSRSIVIGVVALAATVSASHAQTGSAPACTPRQAAEAWWTGPMLANSAATLPKGHVAVESYLYDATVQGSFDGASHRHSAPRSNSFGSLTYAIYGLASRLSVGFIPTAGFNTVSGGPSSSGVGLGDVGTLAQIGVTRARPCHAMPSIAVAVQETYPTGRYDLLGDHPADGVGSGVYTTALSVFSQKAFVLPNNRILRMRFNVTQSVSSSATVRDVSVYGTSDGFRGRARPGSSTYVDAAWEYSVTRRWVVALDATFRYAHNTRVSGVDSASRAVVMNSGPSQAFALAPAIEYNWSPSWGVLVGTRLVPAGRNTLATITPAIALNFSR